MIFVDSNIAMYIVGREHPLKLPAQRALEHAASRRERLVVRQPSFDASWRSFTPLAALLLLDVGPATPALERLASDAKSSPDRLSIEG